MFLLQASGSSSASGDEVWALGTTLLAEAVISGQVCGLTGGGSKQHVFKAVQLGLVA